MKCKFCDREMSLEEYCYHCDICDANYYEDEEMWECGCSNCSYHTNSKYDKTYRYEDNLYCESCFLEEVGLAEVRTYHYSVDCETFECEEDFIEYYLERNDDLEVIE